MAWRERLLYWCGPGVLAGVTIGEWLRLLLDNCFNIPPRYWPRACLITTCSIGNSISRVCEDMLYARRIATKSIESPLFVLGIWRSGTTHLQNLFAVDRRFATPNWFEVCYPHSFLTTERFVARPAGFFLPKRRLQDEVRLGFDQPSEDEFALCGMTGLSPMLSWTFPKRSDHYDRYLTFRNVDCDEVERWKAALLTFARKLAWKYRKPLVLKSPCHTARIRLLLEMFPDAKFVHIRRDPHAVLRSAVRMHYHIAEYIGLQRPAIDVEGRTIRQYRETYDAFFEQKDLIPAGRLHELRYEDLESDPIGQMRACYESLDLSSFDEVEDELRRYVATLIGYRKNVHAELDPATRQQIATDCRRCFDSWGYAA